MINGPNRSKPLLVIIAILLLANIGALAYFIANKPGTKKAAPAPQRKNMMANYLKTDIGFTTTQLTEFDSLSKAHHKALEPLFEQLKAEKEDRLKFLSDNDYSDSAISQAVISSSEKQQMLDRTMLQHLKNVRALCTAEQKSRFDTSIYKIMVRRGGDKKKPKK